MKIVHRKAFHLVFLVGMWLVMPNLLCQHQDFAFKHLSWKDGLSNSKITSILQDHEGFMWFATIDGLNRYDGNEVKIFTNDINDSLSLSNNFVESLYEDSKGRLWVCTTNGLNRLNPEFNNFTIFRHREGDPNSLSSSYVRQVLEDDGLLWAVTLGGGINLWDPESGHAKHFRSNPDDAGTISNDWVWVVFIDSKERVWFGTLGGGLNLYDRQTGQFTRFLISDTEPAFNRVRCIHEVSENELLLGTNGGVVRFRIDNGNIQIFQNERDNPTSISGGEVRDIFEDSAGNLWVASQYGLNLFDSNSNEFITVSKNEVDENGLNASEIWDIEEDDQGTVWFGTYNGGVNYTNLNQAHLKFWSHDSYGKNGLAERSVLSFEETKDGRMWIGYDRGGISLFDGEKGILKTIKNNPDDSNSLSSNNILSLKYDRKGALWSGTWAGGLNCLYPNGSISRFVAPGLFFKEWHIWDLHEDAQGLIWIASFPDGYCFDPRSNVFKQFNRTIDDLDSLSYPTLFDVYEDSNAEIWFGGTYGLCRYDKSTDTFLNYPYQQQGIDLSTTGYTVLKIIEDKYKNLWVGTSEYGLCYFDTKTMRFKDMGFEADLKNNAVYSLELDGNGHLWMSTSKGLVKVLMNEKGEIEAVSHFDTSFKIGDANFNLGASLKKSNGELYFGCSDGFVYFLPDSINVNQHKPKVVLTGFQIFNEEVPIQSSANKNSPLKKDISHTKSLQLTHKQAIFTIKYSALAFISSEKTAYAYMLEGFENEWNYVGNKRYATYSNLKPGTYVFKVKAANNEGLWNDQETQLTIVVIPPYWERWWFRLLGLCIVGALIYLFFELRLRFIKRQKTVLSDMVSIRTHELNVLNDRLEQQYKTTFSQKEELQKHKNHLEDMVSERTSELEKAKAKAEEADQLKSSFLSNMSHEIRTPLNSIIGFSALVSDPELSGEERKSFLEVINSSSDSLLKLVDDIMDLSLIESNQLKIRRQPFDLNREMKLVYQMLKSHAKNEAVEFIYDNTIEAERLMINSDLERMKQIVVNFVNNAFKFTSEGYIKLRIGLEKETLVISVADTGTGIEAEYLNAIFDRFRKIEDDKNKLYRGTGLGLAICRHIAEALGGTITVESQLGKGSVFYFRLPVGKDNN